ncbi:MAG: precorrin-2 C(20)-methyltransferase [Planctomycetota bacterium]|jgi:precorrin-2/cobalt-factor-2 C20-methyltransferase|nr:precorrin-2 C(20)-methyltransferase [Planctomycetota bacterium]
MAKGILYGVGVGPGDPGLMTLKAVEVIRKCGVVAAPRTPGGATIALDIARRAMDLGDKAILALDFAMSPDAAARRLSHAAAANKLREALDAGNSVAMLSLGDVTIYSSFRYVADLLAPEGYAIEMIAGVPSFCAAAAALGVPLTAMDTPLLIVPDGAGEARMPPGGNTVVVYMKSGRRLSDLLLRLRAAGRLDDAMLVQDCGLPNERIVPKLTHCDYGRRYRSLVVVKPGGRASGS